MSSPPEALPSEASPPDGIRAEHSDVRSWERHANPLSILILGIFLAMALLGFAGGQPSPVRQMTHPVASLAVKAPKILRNGEFFEMMVTIKAAAPMEDAVIAISSDLLRDMTINTMIPAPDKESYRHGAYHFSYGPMAAGDVLRVKIDGQVNPALFGGTRGDIRLLDGAVPITGLPMSISVRP